MRSAICFIAINLFLFSSADAQVTLVNNGKPVATIVVPDGQTKNTDREDLPVAAANIAAKELQTFIAKASGARLPIVTASKAPLKSTLILVGRSKLSQKFGLTLPSKSEGVRITTFPRGLAILGEVAPKGTNNRQHAHDRGTLNATYLFLEKFVGFRFYFRRGSHGELGIVVPRKPTVTVGPVDFVSAPAFPYRAIVPYSGSGDWKAATREGKGTAFSCNHTHYGWNGLYGKTNPEYFSLGSNGKRNYRFLCYGNPDVIQKELEHTATYYKTGRRIGGSPGEKYIPVEPGDNWSECRCEKCQALIEPNRGRFGRHSRLWWDHYVRNLGLAVKKRWPDKRVAALAYQGRVLPGKKELPDNVDVQVCIHNSPLNFYKEPSSRDEIRKLLRAWSKKLGGDRRRLYVWDYTCYPQYWSCAPTIYPHTLQQFLREHRQIIGGVFLNGGDETIQADHYMVAFTFALQWNPDLDVDAHLKDYCQKFFGPAADPMERMYQLLIDRYEKTRWPSYRPARYTSYATPSMFYGRTYTPPVVERIEQLLCEAERAAGRIPDGRVAQFVGEGWMLRRNPTKRQQPFEIVVEASDQAVHQPTIKWDGGQLQYRGTLVRGQKLVVRPGPKAKLLPAKSRPADEMIPLDRRLATGLKPFAKGYVVHTARNLRIATFPGAKFRVQMTGKAEGGGNSFVAVQWSTGKWSYHLRNSFDNKPRTVSEIITAPPNARGLHHVYFYRVNQKGTVWYGDLSLRREFAKKKSSLPPGGKDVSSLVMGNAPTLPPRTSQIFHVFANTAAESDSAKLRVTVRAVHATETHATKPTVYQRRVAWMRDGWEHFHPRRSMYRTHDGFLVAARMAHKWIGRSPKYLARRVKSAPPNDLAATAWKKAAKTALVRGRSRAGVPVNNLGFDAGNGPTEVRVVHDTKHVYVAFRCRQPEKPNERDSVTLTLFGKRNKQVVSVTCKPNKGSSARGVTWSTKSGPGWWAAFIAIPKSAIGNAKDLRADLLRTRKDRSYVWSPQLNAPWISMPMSRRGRIVLEK